MKQQQQKQQQQKTEAATGDFYKKDVLKKFTKSIGKHIRKIPTEMPSCEF